MEATTTTLLHLRSKALFLPSVSVSRLVSTFTMSNSNSSSSSNTNTLLSHMFWNLLAHEHPPSELDPSYQTNPKNLFESTLFPRCLAWISVNDAHVSLIEGYNAVCYTPPTLMMSSSMLPSDTLQALRTMKRCTLSAVTAHETPSIETLRQASKTRDPPQTHPFSDLGLSPVHGARVDYPPPVAKSPIHMFCTLEKEVFFRDEYDAPHVSSPPSSPSYSMILLTMETVVVDGLALSPATDLMKEGRSDVTAKIDCDLLRPWMGLGMGQFSLLAYPLRSMPRPKRQPDGSWHSTEFELNPGDDGATLKKETSAPSFDNMEWSFRRDGRSCSLGYNPVTAIILPRPIGWISTYRQAGVAEDPLRTRVPHLAPYSFFSDVARPTNKNEYPMVAFSGYRRDGVDKKDAQSDAEHTKCFAYNLTSEHLAQAMNYSAAELSRQESEFELAGLSREEGRLVDAPLVRDAQIRYECQYVKTVDVGTFSIVVGRLVGIHIHPNVAQDGVINPFLGRPITRLGYMNEYGTLP